MKTLIGKTTVAIALSLALPGLALAQQAAEPAKPAVEAKPAAEAKPTASAPAANAAATPADKDKVASLMGYRLTQRPVPTLREARVYAGEWITAGYLSDFKIGRVHKVGGLYIADLVGQDKKLANQLLIRKRDGFSVLVYPGMPKQQTPEQMVGMAGLEGMSGMSEMKAIQAKPAAHGGFNVGSARHARRIVDAWLLFNGLPNLYAGSTRDLGGIYVTRVVNGGGKEKNQAVMRKSDGYIQMMHPVAAIGAKKP